ncbi:unnamed protein product [Choristocarpus tenellus]
MRGFSTSHSEEDVAGNGQVTTKVVVFGGSGFVGQRVCQAAAATGAQVTSVNRSGAPSKVGPWARDVRWVKADIFSPDDYINEIEGAVGVVSCVGSFGSDSEMERVCGDATVVAAGVAKEVMMIHHVPSHNKQTLAIVCWGFY